MEEAGTSTCHLGFEAGRTTATVTGPAGENHVELPLARPSTLVELVARHRAVFADDWVSDPPDRWADATEELLEAVHRRLLEPLLDLVGGHPVVRLSFGHPLLASLPIESAHRPGWPALLDLGLVHRRHPGPIAPICPADDDRRSASRRFRTEVHRLGTTGLPAVDVETHLVGGTPGRRHGQRSERLIHLMGHEPTIPDGLVGLRERAHVVLSGCTSLPAALPPGVASATASLWPLDDTSAPAFLATLHRRIDLGVGPAEALRQVQLLHRPLPPSTWATFVHLGETQ